MSAVPSPCISICRLDPASRRCEGCFRTTSEIEAWMVLGNEERMAIWRALAQHLGVSLEAALATRVGEARARELVRSHVGH